MNRMIDSPALERTLRLVQYRDAFTEKTKLSGVSSRHLAQLSGLKAE
jgi:hypothetical protein